MEKIKNNIKDNIADTLYIPLLMKKRETERENSFYSDPTACELVNKIDYDFDKYGEAKRSSIGVALRSSYFDDVTKTFILENKDPVIVSIGCGLDTRYERLGHEITKNAFFYELDLPEAIELRRQLLPENSNQIYLENSMLETDWMDELSKKHEESQFLFLIEGVFMYFEKDVVKSVLLNIGERFQSARFLFDVTTSWMRKNSHRHDTVKLTNAVFKLDYDDDCELEEWSSKFKLISTQFYCDFEHSKRAGFVNYWAMKLVPKIKQASRILYYQLN